MNEESDVIKDSKGTVDSQRIPQSPSVRQRTSRGSKPAWGCIVTGSQARILWSSPPEYRTPLPPMARHCTFSPP